MLRKVGIDDETSFIKNLACVHLLITNHNCHCSVYLKKVVWAM